MARVSIPLIPVSRKRFKEIVNIEAHRIWRGKVWERECRDWYDAHREVVSPALDPIFRKDARYAGVKMRGEQLYDERKDGDALEDWLVAEQNIACLYVVVG